MAKPLSAQTVWSALALVVVALACAGSAYLFLVTAKVEPVPVKTRQFAVNAVAELRFGKENNYQGNVFVKTVGLRGLPPVFQGEPSVPYDPKTELGKPDLSSRN